MTSNSDKRSQIKSAVSQVSDQADCESKDLKMGKQLNAGSRSDDDADVVSNNQQSEKQNRPFDIGVGEDFDIVDVPVSEPPDEPPSNGPFSLKNMMAAVIFGLLATHIYEKQYIGRLFAFVTEEIARVF